MHEWINRTTPRITAAIRRSKERIQTTTISIAEYMKENPNLQQARETLKKAKNKANQNTNQKTRIKRNQVKTKKVKQSKSKTKDEKQTATILAPITQWFRPKKQKRTDLRPP